MFSKELKYIRPGSPGGGLPKRLLAVAGLAFAMASA
jgi:hypothetical protein